jgi:hypothetical protein
MADVNFPNINWVTHESDTAGSEFRDLIMDNYLVQHDNMLSFLQEKIIF